MLEYNEMMLRPLLYPGGRIHNDPERQTPAFQYLLQAGAAAKSHHRWRMAVVGGILLAALLAL